MMITIGITGGVGAGKSTVLDFLEEKYQAYVMKADEIGHLVMEPGQSCYEPVIALFGRQIIKNDKTIDRRQVSDVVFSQEFSNGNTDFYLTGKDEEINLIIKTTDGKLKQYYADYKDYYYLPEEDTVIPKSLGSGIDRKHRKAATRNTCYTWFTCSDAFLSSPVQQKQYLTYTLSCLIGTLERV